MKHQRSLLGLVREWMLLGTVVLHFAYWVLKLVGLAINYFRGERSEELRFEV